ncbi:hypothetical protein [Polyangium jinanense]|uniref:Uncharacterized protein n=1 Tax=Polyangium jinanense TaxID=2829994 RepID=A0A9X3X0X9_9BACT|nr:hypothetical protein [Polyangium jinanense]MDC3953513.1 hypothetical protein [Polyangium jinanense]MDC3979366.1 hypothetical protein [Polyangium jinanense]
MPRSLGDAKATWREFARFVVCALGWVVLVGSTTGCMVDDMPALSDMVTTVKLREYYGNPNNYTGITYNQAVGLQFQRDVLGALPGPRVLSSNRKVFPSAWRQEASNERFRGVIPDGVTAAVEGFHGPLPPVISTHPESTFVEVKAVKGVVNLEYAQYQILGMLDALSKSPAAFSTGPDRAYPSLYFVVTGDTSIGTDVGARAASLQILVWVSPVRDHGGGELQVAPPWCFNCDAVFPGKQLPAPTLPGPSFYVQKLRAANDRGLDKPILDDGLVGHPGTPGNTRPH